MASLLEKAIKDAVWISTDHPSGPESHVMDAKTVDSGVQARPD